MKQFFKDAIDFVENRTKSDQHTKEIKNKLKDVYKDVYKSIIKLEKQNGKHLSDINK
tara:strand:+ start:41 stop:211 length:171 start_codon:yes stop_codon:yes gene_type:complete